MREMNYQTSTQQTKQTKQFRGGEKKVMKKRLALLLSVAMAFSMFANVAFGADAAKTTQEKFDALKTQGVFNGYPDGSAGLEKDMTRAEFAKVLVKLFGLKEIHGEYSYKDKNYGAKNWAAPFIEAVTKEGLMQGKDLTKKIFDFNGKITVEEASKTLVTALKLTPVKDAQNNASAWAKEYFQAAVDAGLFSKDANPKANATRTQLVEAAYAADELVKGPKVASYKVIDSKNVEFTMTDKEVVKVTLEKALEANKETEVKFQYKGKDVTAKVTYAITAAQKIESVTSENLKEVVVKFDGSVDKKSAEKEDNYEVKDAKIDSVKLLDKNTVYILLKEEDSSTMKNQKEIELKVKGVQNEDKSKTFDQKVKFTPIDVKTPEVKEVVGLGTKAFKVVFSEPVKRTGVFTTSNYKVDGKTVSASVKYVYPNIAIVTTDLPVGEHKVTVSNVEDFSGLKIAPIEKTFTIAEDTTAPEVVSATAKDPMELEIVFNETVKSIGKIYHGNSSNTGEVEIKDNVVTVKFEKSKALYLGENTVHIEGVTDYSDNKSNREVKVNPSLDAERPEVTKVELKNNDHQIILTFNKELDASSATNRDNFILKDKDGKFFKHDSVNKADGKILTTPTYKKDKKTVTIELLKPLDEGDYILEVNGIKDNAYVSNTMLPFSKKITADAKAGSARAWTSYDGNQDYIYIQFPKAVKTDGEGDATVKAKYTVFGKTLNDDYETPVLVQPDTIRIDAKRGTFLTTEGKVKLPYTPAVVVNLVKDIDGDYFEVGESYKVVINELGEAKVTYAEKATVSDRNELKVKLTGKLNSVDVSDFKVTTEDGTKVPNSYQQDGNTLTLKFNDNNKLPADLFGAKLVVVNDNSTDTFGNRIQKFTADVTGEIRPEATDVTVKSVTGATYLEAEVSVNAIVYSNFDANTFKNFFSVEVNGKSAEVTQIVAAKAGDKTQKTFKIVFNLPKDVTEVKSDTTFRVELKEQGTTVIQDRQGNAIKDFYLPGYFVK
ncbi:S-layer domain-containing protein [Paenibacillus alvei TS-15]|uniref:S-layer domain-containing protein n=1 Tax=Paenibacillus alvei TS-15 TaxID=1117108 RepID=S9UBY7_PAEAL|nr:S-layer homology domain-containing protein [Paenibacillus alvei]EPY07975.1 S-layer domain-containing protein [Paenibacillus alvei TS-15]